MKELKLIKSRIILGVSLAKLENFIDKKGTIIITDENVFQIYRDRLSSFRLIVMKPGEKSKTLKYVYKIYRDLLDLGCHRNTFILGFGGGVICDITGFVASTFLRGLSFGFFPTTLLAQTDAAIGGKNGVNLDGYKNIVGTITQPEFVLVDHEILRTLPEKELKNGFAEIIKHAIIGNERLFYSIEKEERKKVLTSEGIENILYDSIKVKVDIVSKDEKEKGERRKLNFGHTFGHAIESVFSLPHGEAIGIGMAVEARLSFKKGILSQEDFLRILRVLKKFHLLTGIEKEREKLMDAIMKDKKREGRFIYGILVEKIGKVRIEKIGLEDIDGALRDYFTPLNLENDE